MKEIIEAFKEAGITIPDGTTFEGLISALKSNKKILRAMDTLQSAITEGASTDESDDESDDESEDKATEETEDKATEKTEDKATEKTEDKAKAKKKVPPVPPTGTKQTKQNGNSTDKTSNKYGDFTIKD